VIGIPVTTVGRGARYTESSRSTSFLTRIEVERVEAT
jgi:hypothetical protein